jgi:hypothetical protein
VTRDRPKRRAAAWLFPTVGKDNDRVVPWLGPARSIPCVLAWFAIYLAAADYVLGPVDVWAPAPAATAATVVVGFCGRRKDGSRARHRVIAVIAACTVFVAVWTAGVALVPAAGHDHPGPLRGLVFLVAGVVAVYAFVAVTHARRRAAPPVRDPGWPGLDDVR